MIGGYTGNAVSNNATGATIAGGGSPGNGYSNPVSADFGTVSGGTGNTASGFASVVAGGANNTAGGVYTMVAGGESNSAAGNWSFAAGYGAHASDDGSFVWCQLNGNTCNSNGTNSFTVSVDGPIYFYDGSSGEGCYLSSGSGRWTCSSDRNLKDDIESIDSRSVLERVAQMPVTQWRRKSDTAGHKHIGPMAQDFYAAFGLGESDKYIAHGDAQGVALASIQGLYQLVQETRALLQEKDERFRKQDHEIQALRDELRALESQVEAAQR